MLKFIIGKTLRMTTLLIALCAICFWLVNYSPIDPVQAYVGADMMHFQPLPNALPPGCLFEPRCRLATPECGAAQPGARELRGGMVRCIHAA